MKDSAKHKAGALPGADNDREDDGEDRHDGESAEKRLKGSVEINMSELIDDVEDNVFMDTPIRHGNDDDTEEEEGKDRAVEPTQRDASPPMSADDKVTKAAEEDMISRLTAASERTAVDGDAEETFSGLVNELETPPPSPGGGSGAGPLAKDEKPSLFSLAQMSLKLNELWSSAREKVFGGDYWIPSDPYEVAIFPQELLAGHRIVYPVSTASAGPSSLGHSQQQPTAQNRRSDTGADPSASSAAAPLSHFSLMVVQGSLKNEPGTELHHVVYTFNADCHRESLTIFRSKDMSEAVDFCRRCEECRVLLRLLDKKKDARKSIRDITNKFQIHPLWRMVHIAIACCRTDIFSDEGLKYLTSIGYTKDDITKTVSSPEGQTPLMYAIETNQLSIVRFLLKIGANPADHDIAGNNAMHYAALASVQMLETVWENEGSKPLLNQMNNDGYTPVLLAIRNANPRCLATLLGFGAELSIRISGKNPLFEALQSKSKTSEVIKTILEASPNLLTEVDEATGNTALHIAQYKTPLMGLLYLRAKELDLNVRNKAGQTALHLYASRGDLGMILTLASYNCDLNVPNQNGNTALHLAVSKRFLLITRLLLCLGANPNIANENNDTPRHLAAKLNEQDLVKSLIVCGAKRCPPTKTGCVRGCVNKRSMRLVNAKSHSASSQDVVAEKSTVHASPAQLAHPKTVINLEDWENRKFTDHEKQYRYNKYQDMEHNEIYDEMLQRLAKMAEAKEENRNIINILSLDGGGVRGLIICQILIEVEKVLGEPIFPYFDWVAGTSTGGLVATALSIGYDLRHIQLIYLRFKDLIFEGWSRPYNSMLLESFIQNEMGAKTTLAELNWPRLMFMTTRADSFPVVLELMRNYRLPLSDEENDELGYSNPDDLPVWKAMRRTSAAPTYFSCVDNKYIDGGIISNNPTLELFTEIQFWNSVNKMEKLPNAVEVGCVLSIGTGVIPSLPLDPNQLEFSANLYSTAIAIKNLGTILVDQVTATEGAPVSRASSWSITHRMPYFRLSPPIFKEVAMDSKDDLDLTRMMWDCMEYTYRHREYIEKMCELLRKVGKSWTRRSLFRKVDASRVDMETQTSRPVSPCKEATPESLSTEH